MVIEGDVLGSEVIADMDDASPTLRIAMVQHQMHNYSDIGTAAARIVWVLSRENRMCEWGLSREISSFRALCD